MIGCFFYFIVWINPIKNPASQQGFLKNGGDGETRTLTPCGAGT